MSVLMKWLEQERKLDAALLSHMQVKEIRHPALGDALSFPYHKDEKPYAAKFRTIDKKWRSSQGITRGLYNADALKYDDDLPIVITEGEIDCISVMQAGFTRAVSLPDGWTADAEKTDSLLACEDDLRKSPFVIVAGDNDEAGQSLPRAVANILKGHEVRHVVWPDGCKDANDVLQVLGEGDLAACLNKAKAIDPPDGFITSISDLPPLPKRRVLTLNGFEKLIAFELGALSVSTGTPGSGKSTFSTWVADRIAKMEEIKVGLMAFETHPHQVRDQLARINTGKPWDELAAGAKEVLEHDLDKRWRIVHRTFDGGQHHLGWLEKMVYTLAVRDQCKLIVIDPWNELEHLPETGENMTSYINFALQQLRVWAEKLNVHIHLVAHPKKMPTEGKPRIPVGYDIADSAAFANKPAFGFTVHQGKDKEGLDCVQIKVWKVRNTQLYGFGKTLADVDFDIQRMTYSRL